MTDKPGKPDDVDREAPTPRHGLSNTWELHTTKAKQLSGQLDDLERAVRAGHPAQADLYRGLRVAMRSFEMRFERWNVDPTISFLEKSNDLEDFGTVREAVLKLIARVQRAPSR